MIKQQNLLADIPSKEAWAGCPKRGSRLIIALIVLALVGAAVRHLLFPDFFDVWPDTKRFHVLLVFALFCGLGLACNSMEIKRKASEIDHRLFCVGKTEDLSNKNANWSLFVILVAMLYFEFTVTMPKQGFTLTVILLYFLVAMISFTFTRNTAIETEFLWVKIAHVVVPLLVFLFSGYFASQNFMNVFSSPDNLLDKLLNYKGYFLIFVLPIFSIQAAVRIIKYKRMLKHQLSKS